MKKIWLSLLGMVFAFAANAAPYTDGKQYTTLDKPIQDAPKVIEFFSFLCPHCYDFERTFGINKAVIDNLPANVKLTRYHVDFLGGEYGVLLTRTWAVAIALGVEDKVLDPIFDGLQKKQTIKNPQTLKDAFIKAAGITSAEYDAAWNSFAVNALVSKQEKAVADFKIEGVPAFYVNGKYLLRNEGMDSNNAENFKADFSNVIKFLLAQ